MNQTRYLTVEQRRERDARIVERLHANPTTSDRKLVRDLHTSSERVARMRRELEASGALPPCAERRASNGAKYSVRSVSLKTTERCQHVRQLFASGNGMVQTAAQLHITERSLRQFMRRHNIPLPRWSTGRAITRQSTMSTDRAIVGAVNGITAAVHGLGVVDIRKAQLDPQQARDLSADLRRTLPRLVALQHALDAIAAPIGDDMQ